MLLGLCRIHSPGLGSSSFLAATLTLLESLENEVKGTAMEPFSGHTSLLFAHASFWGQFLGSEGFTVAVITANTRSEGQT